MSKVVGINYSRNKDGQKVSTIQCVVPYEEYYNSPENGREAIGERVESLYVGTYNVDHISVGDEIEVYFSQARTTSKGAFQQVKKIEVL